MANFRRVTAAIVLTIAAAPCWAWNQAGHMTTGAIAYSTLKKDNPQALAKILATLHQHPQFDTLWAKQLDRVDAADRDEALFMLAARWPDDIRDNPDYNHAEWHYIDYGYKPAGQPDGIKIADPRDPNILVGYRSNVEVLNSRTASAGEKAIALCWIMHLTGDSHQPLHAVSLFSTNFPPPRGDQGGTKAFVLIDPDAPAMTLHKIWDDLVIVSMDTRDVHKRAIELRGKYLRNDLDKQPTKVAAVDIDKWIQESFQLAKSNVYLEGKLKTSPYHDDPDLLPNDYLTKSKAIAERRLTQSGYRMADVLAKIAPSLDISSSHH
jgi:hypothetical protein